MDHHDGVLAAGEEEQRAFELGGDFAHDENRLVLELLEVGQVVGTHGREKGEGDLRSRFGYVQEQKKIEFLGIARAAWSRCSGRARAGRAARRLTEYP